MWRLLILVSVQSALLCAGQVLLKLAVAELPPFAWSRAYVRAVATDWWLLACGVAFGAASLLWLYILRHFPFSQAYPLTALGYVFGLVAALLVFGESVPPLRWLGVGLIVLGCLFVMR